MFSGVVAVVPERFFVEALVGLSEQLGELSSKKRAKGLQEGLERINEFFLSDRAQGSDVIYVPFGGGFHQAWLDVCCICRTSGVFVFDNF